VRRIVTDPSCLRTYNKSAAVNTDGGALTIGGMIMRKSFAALLALLLVSAMPADAKEFTYDAKVNEQVAKKLKIPVFFAVPASARASLPASIDATDRLIDFKHPDAVGAQGDVGLRLIVGKRAGLARRLGKTGLIQTGDILLSVRPEWGGAGAYPNVQMGVTHSGIAYIKDGVLHNLDNPMDAEFLGTGLKGELNGKHYQTINLIHVIRPRNLTDKERANLLEWITRLASNAKKVYPSQISFNKDYNAPKYKRGASPEFVKHLGQIALAQNPPGTIDMFCSEFAWSVLALKNCEPATSADAFQRSGVPSCVKPAMTPMSATGDYVFSRSRKAYAGLADGPLLVIDSMKLPDDKEAEALNTVFQENAQKLAKMSSGHRALAEQMRPHFAPLQTYYIDAATGGWGRWRARTIRFMSNRKVPDNYSPTSYLINTLLPADNANRTMDYVATIVIE
jgi:hypothetical protein